MAVRSSGLALSVFALASFTIAGATLVACTSFGSGGGVSETLDARTEGSEASVAREDGGVVVEAGPLEPDAGGSKRLIDDHLDLGCEGWTSRGGTAFATGSLGHDKAPSCQICQSAAGDQLMTRSVVPDVGRDAVAAGRYTLRAWMMSGKGSGALTGEVGFQVYVAGDAAVADVAATSVATIADKWVSGEVSITIAETNVTELRVAMAIIGGSGSACLDFDDVALDFVPAP